MLRRETGQELIFVVSAWSEFYSVPSSVTQQSNFLFFWEDFF